MHKIDIIIPFYVLNQRLPIRLYKWKPDWFPVMYNLINLRKHGVEVRFFTLNNLKYTKLSNIVGIDSKIIHNFNMNTQKINGSKTTRINLLINFLMKLKKKVNRIIFFDTKDGTNILYEILLYVEKYYKKQLLKDPTLYLKNLYKDRTYTDFYARNYDILKDNFETIKSNDESHKGFEKINTKLEENIKFNYYSKYKDKISLSWNIALSNYHLSNNFLIRYTYKKIDKRIKFYKPSLNRKFKFYTNINTEYS